MNSSAKNEGNMISLNQSGEIKGVVGRNAFGFWTVKVNGDFFAIVGNQHACNGLGEEVEFEYDGYLAWITEQK